MNTTQQHLSIVDIKDDILILKDGGGALVLQTSAVNFGLLSEREQMGIIFAFAQLLNSLSFSIQIVIHSERLNISSYLRILDKAQASQSNLLLSQMMTHYKTFIQSTVKENEVLDKKFYIVIPLFKLELGLSSSKETLDKKIKTILLPRRDQIMKQLNRIGLKATQLTNQKLLTTFFEIYNSEAIPDKTSELEPVKLISPQTTQPATKPPPSTSVQPPPISTPTTQSTRARTHPFVVEELSDSV